MQYALLFLGLLIVALAIYEGAKIVAAVFDKAGETEAFEIDENQQIIIKDIFNNTPHQPK